MDLRGAGGIYASEERWSGTRAEWSGCESKCKSDAIVIIGIPSADIQSHVILAKAALQSCASGGEVSFEEILGPM